MGVTVLPESFFGTGGKLAGVGRGLSSIFQPNKEFQAAFRRLVASNPQLVQELAAAERQSPGLLESLRIGGRERAVISAAPKSFQEILNESAKIGFETMSPEDLQRFATARALGTMPTVLAREKVLAPAVGKVGEEKPELVAAGAEALISGQTRGQRAQEDLDLVLFGNANAYLATLPVSEAQKGSAREKIPGLFAEEDFLMRLSLQMGLANANSARDFQEQLNRLREADAQWWVRQTSVGTSEQWNQFLHNPEVRTDPKFADINKAFVAVGVERKVAEFTATSREITAMLDRLLGRGNIPEAPDETKPLIAQQLNQAFARQNALGAPLFRAVLGPSGFLAGAARVALPKGMEGRFKKIRFLDEQGNEVDEQTIMLMTSTPMVNIARPPQPVPQDTIRVQPQQREVSPEELVARFRAGRR